MLPWDESEPGGEMSALPKSRAVTNGSDQGGRHQYIDIGDFEQFLAGTILACNQADPMIQLLNLRLQGLPLLPKLEKQLPQERGETIFGVLENPRHLASQIGPALRKVM